jgi:hypothetical protein
MPAYAIASGVGWSASWAYDTTHTFHYTATLPGVRVTGLGVDNSGTALLTGRLEDTANDSRCAWVQIYAFGTTGGYLAKKTACGLGAVTVFNTTTFTDGVHVVLARIVPGDDLNDMKFGFTIPSSLHDAGLRTPGTGAGFAFTSATTFRYDATRTGAHLLGYGSNQGGDKRSSVNVIQNTQGGTGCASGEVLASQLKASGAACTTGGVAVFSRFDLVSSLSYQACYQRGQETKRCLAQQYVPVPKVGFGPGS